jgi:RimJ/RimL family protein N-acetyltransferase
VPQAATQTLSERYWGIDWAAELPWIADEFRIDLSNFDEIASFFAEHGPEMFGKDAEGRWLQEPMGPAKLQFLRESDVLAFRHDEKLVGYLLGQPSDWSSYYVRSLTILPRWRGQGLIAAIAAGLDRTLRTAGVQRIEADTASDNAAMALGFLRHGWVATGFNNSDRWGATVRYTRYLTDEATAVFRNQYCLDVRPRCRVQKSPIGAGRDQPHEEVRSHLHVKETPR